MAPHHTAPARLSDAPLPTPDFSAPAWPGGTEVVDGSSVYLRRTPGPAGLGGSSTNWTDLAGLLSGYVDGVALDLHGFGWSDPAPRGNYSLSMHGRTAANLEGLIARSVEALA